MKVVFMDTGRGNHRGVIEGWRTKLELRGDDSVSLLSWQPPREPLPVVEHLVFGPRLDPRRKEPRRSETAYDLFHDADIDSSAMRREDAKLPPKDSAAEKQAQESDAVSGEAESSLGEADLAEQMPETVLGSDALDPEAFAGDEEFDEAVAGSVRARATTLPVYHPTRLRKAALWRANRVRITARNGYRGVKRRVRASDSRPARVAQTLMGATSDGIATQFALSVARSDMAAEVFRGADLVMPMDSRSQRAAWVLAHRIDGPAVVVGFPAGIRALDARRSD